MIKKKKQRNRAKKEDTASRDESETETTGWKTSAESKRGGAGNGECTYWGRSWLRIYEPMYTNEVISGYLTFHLSSYVWATCYEAARIDAAMLEFCQRSGGRILHRNRKRYQTWAAHVASPNAFLIVRWILITIQLQLPILPSVFIHVAGSLPIKRTSINWDLDRCK